MSTPDRIERAVERSKIASEPSIEVATNKTIKLLRREASYQRARVRKAINFLRRQHMVGSTRVVEEADFNYAYMAACDDLLTALDGTKGKR